MHVAAIKMTRRNQLNLAASAWALASALGVAAAHAQTTSQPTPQPTPSAPAEVGVQEVVVTAQRRAEKLQDVPIAIQAITSKAAVAQGITNVQSLNGTVPSLSVSQNGPQNVFFIRGVGSPVAAPNGEQSVAIYIDGIYLYAPVGNMFPIGADLERIEILKGPQGTLFGRNSTAGVIQIITKDPKAEFSGEASIGYGNYNTITADAYITGLIAKNLAADLAVTIKNMGDGYGFNPTTHQDTYRTDQYSARSKWMWTPDAETVVKATFSYDQIDGDLPNRSILRGHVGLDGIVSTVQPYDAVSDFGDSWHGGIYLAALQFDRDLGFAKLENIFSFRTVSPSHFLFDDDATASPIINAAVNEPSTTYTEEVRLLSPPSQKFNWVTGLFYINANTNLYPLDLSGTGVAPPPTHIYEFDYQNLWAIAPYGQATLELFKDTDLTGGVRYNYENISHQGTRVESPIGHVLVPAIPGHQSYDNVSFRVALDHKWTSAVMTYFSVNRSYKSGGYNLAAAPGTSLPPFLPEQLTAYEAGIKSEWLERRLRINASYYHYDYVNIQVQSSVPAGTLTYNGPSAHYDGGDVDFAATPFRGFTLSGGANYVEGYYGHFPNAVAYHDDPALGSFVFGATGKRTVYSPRWSANLAADYVYQSSIGDFDFNANLAYTGKQFTAVDNRLDLPAFAVQNDSVTWNQSNGGPYSVRLWVLNALGRVYYSNILETGTGDWAFYAPPRTFGVTLTRRF